MNTPNVRHTPPHNDHRSWRQHRFMESADINAAFRQLFGPLRTSIRRGLTNEGQVYAIEMDACIPGEMLDLVWIPPSTRGVVDPLLLANTGRRRALFSRLLVEPRPESLFAYVCERGVKGRKPLLYVEIVSADASYAAEYPVCTGRGWARRDLVLAPHRRVDLHARA